MSTAMIRFCVGAKRLKNVSYLGCFVQTSSRIMITLIRGFSGKEALGTTGPTHLQKARLSKILSTYAKNIAISRREAERMIKSGQVTVAGKTLASTTAILNISDLRNGALCLDGKSIQIKSPGEIKYESENVTTRVWAVHKLFGELVTESDPHDRPSLIQRLERGGVGKAGKTRMHLKPIGRLDMPTEGLILVTNDGDYAREMELPRNQLHRTYRVKVHGLVTNHKLERIQKGLTIDGVRYPPMKVALENPRKAPSTNRWLTMTCTQGKNRQVRNVLKYLGCKSHHI